MTAWEYRSIVIYRVPEESVDEPRVSTWRADFQAGEMPAAFEGIDETLSFFGADGWELVSFVPETQRHADTRFGPLLATQVYRATFKRPID